jgi:hypothetical protein
VLDDSGGTVLPTARRIHLETTWPLKPLFLCS